MLETVALKKLDAFRDQGILFMRVGLGFMFVLHGWPKLAGGPEKWEQLGGAMGTLGINFAPTFWGFMAAITEFGGGILLALGLLTRPVLVGLIITMFVAAWMHFTKGDPFPRIAHPTELGITFAGLLLLGPGRFSIDAKLGLTDVDNQGAQDLSVRSGNSPN